MIFQPAALALLFAVSLNALMLTAAGLFALHLLRHWNPASGSERQIALERRTYLVSSLVGLSLLLSLPALALLVHTADAMAPFFAGAMCAVGSLKVNAWGMPALMAMLAGFFLAAVWLALNHLDAQGWDSPLIRARYRLLLALAPLALLQAVLLWRYFLELKPEVITSCCGSLFGPAATGPGAELAALPVALARPGYFLVWGVTLGMLGWLAAEKKSDERAGGDACATAGATRSAGVLACLRRMRGGALALLAALHFLAALAAILSFIAPAIYEQPNHHCPFCLLQAEHGYAGWALYPLLFLGTAAGLGAGLIHRVRAQSLQQAAPRFARALARVALAGLAGFGLLVVFYLWRSNLVLA